MVTGITTPSSEKYSVIFSFVPKMNFVKGSGVVGEQPVLAPGQAFEYTSGCPLTTPSGIMVGTYEMVDAKGEHFLIDIPAFSLDYPNEPRHLN